MKSLFSKNTYTIGVLFTLFFSFSITAQVGIGTISPNSDALLDVDASSTNGGILLPRIALTSTSSPSPLSADVAGMIVYNTATAGDVTPGFYYNDGSDWMRLANNDDWKLTGNTGTNSGTNFIGTTDAQDVVIKANSIERVRVGTTETVVNEDGNSYNFRVETDNDTNTIFVDGANDNVGIGTNAPASDVKLEVNGGNTNAIFGYSNNVGGYLGRETNITIGLPGNTQTISGAGVYANNPLAGYTSVFSQSTGAANVAANVNYSDVWMANYNYVDNGNSGFNAVGSYTQLNKNEATTAGNHVALKALSTREASGNPGFTVGLLAATLAGTISGTQTEDSYGLIAQATNTASEFAIGGEFIGMGGAGGYIVDIADDLNNRKIVGTGTVSEVIPTENHGRIILTAPESPEYWYQDYGSVQMINGVATIQIDPILSDIIVVDNKNPIRVICTPYQMPYFNGVTIMRYDKKTVEIRELNGGTHSGTLQYQLVAKPKTNYGEGRFPQAHGPYFTKGMNIPKARTKNQNSRNNVFEWPSDWEVYGYETLAKEYLVNGNKIKMTMDNKDKK